MVHVHAVNGYRSFYLSFAQWKPKQLHCTRANHSLSKQKQNNNSSEQYTDPAPSMGKCEWWSPDWLNWFHIWLVKTVVQDFKPTREHRKDKQRKCRLHFRQLMENCSHCVIVIMDKINILVKMMKTENWIWLVTSLICYNFYWLTKIFNQYWMCESLIILVTRNYGLLPL